MEAGDCPPLNINAMRAISVKSYLKVPLYLAHVRLAEIVHFSRDGTHGRKSTCTLLTNKIC